MFLALTLAQFGALAFAIGFIAVLVFLFVPPVTLALIRGGPEKMFGAVSFLGSYMLAGSLFMGMGVF